MTDDLALLYQIRRQLLIHEAMQQQHEICVVFNGNQYAKLMAMVDIEIAKQEVERDQTDAPDLRKAR